MINTAARGVINSALYFLPELLGFSIIRHHERFTNQRELSNTIRFQDYFRGSDTVWIAKECRTIPQFSLGTLDFVRLESTNLC